MPRNMSFLMNKQQILDRTKTVTRRLGWDNLQPGEILNAVEKAQGLKKGEKIVRICQIRIVSKRQECLYTTLIGTEYGFSEVKKEGFPELTPRDFLSLFCNLYHCHELKLVNRIEFEYL